MRREELHQWTLTPHQAIELQSRLASKVERQGQMEKVELLAGADISAPTKDGVARGAVVVLDYPTLDLREVKTAEDRLRFPYIPGLLAFRELPLLLEAFNALEHRPHLVLVDGHGIAHPRRLGIASHLGLFLGLPTIGCAKSLLCGQHSPVGAEEGSSAELVDRDEVIGAVLRTREGANPVYVSIGHKLSLEHCLFWVRQSCRGFRLPEPLRLAHLATRDELKPPLSPPQGKLF